MTALLLEQIMWLPVLDQLSLIHDNNLVKIKNSIEFVSNSDDGM